MIIRRLLALCVVTAVAGVACSSDDPADPGAGGECKLGTCPTDYSAFTPSGNVSFKGDIVPILQRSCNFSSCHNEKGMKADLYLGPKNDAFTDQQVADVIAGMVGAASKTSPSNTLVTAGDPSKSFLMHKIDGCQNSLGLSDCDAQASGTEGECGDNMPEVPLCENERDLFRNWIAAGAKAN